MYKLKKIGVLSLGYIITILVGLSSLVNIIAIYALSGLNGVQLMLNSTNDPTVATALAAMGFWLLPLVFFMSLFGGFLSGIIFAAIYNWIIVKITGGLEIELNK